MVILPRWAGDVDCFGMDEFYIDQAAPVPVPEPGALALMAIGLAGMLRVRRKQPA